MPSLAISNAFWEGGGCERAKRWDLWRCMQEMGLAGRMCVAGRCLLTAVVDPLQLQAYYMIGTATLITAITSVWNQLIIKGVFRFPSLKLSVWGVAAYCMVHGRRLLRALLVTTRVQVSTSPSTCRIQSCTFLAPSSLPARTCIRRAAMGMARGTK